MIRSRHWSFWACACLGAVTLTVPVQAAWIMTEIPNLPGWVGDTEMTGINESGEVCGMGNYVVNTSSTPFRFDGTTVTELPFLPGADAPIALTTGINAAGVICGYSHNATGDSRACYWVGTTIYTIPYPPDANPDADLRVYDINDAGVMVGYCWNTAVQRTAFYYKDGVSYSLDAAIQTSGLTGGQQSASAVNNNNVICGSADDAMGIASAYTYDIDTGVLTVLGQIGFADNSATSINESGRTIGRGKYYSFDQYYGVVTHYVTWDFVDPAPTASQWPGGLNDHNRVVGSSYVTGGGRWGWYSDGPPYGGVIRLDPPGWGSAYFEGINNSDWIVGFGDAPAAGDETRGFIIKPPPGDADHDGDIDLADYDEFADCASGPAEGGGFVPPSEACLRAFDFASPDGDVDLDDFAAFQGTFEGS
ncbi:MAG TPA: hypothetical protein VM243_10345 [Phycisphaerae bacterium]|nr:hypothetical protein [Phycisphaerae bacterium]